MSETQPFPIFLNVAGAGVLIVGEDGEAAGKLRLAARTGARITVVAAQPDGHLLEAVTDCGATLHRRAFERGDLDGMRLCFVALPDAAACADIVAAARARGVLVNAVDKPALCDFIVPAIVDRPPITVAISTGGTAPILARELRRRIEAMVPPAYGHLARFLNGWRARVAQVLPDVLGRRRFWESALDSAAAELLLAGDASAAEAAMARHLAAQQVGAHPAPGRVSLVGAGPGDPELLTLRALRIIQGADLVLHDRGIDRRIIDLARRGARRVDTEGVDGPGIMDLILDSIRQGDHVVLLKAGDPGAAADDATLALLAGMGILADIVRGVALPPGER